MFRLFVFFAALCAPLAVRGEQDAPQAAAPSDVSAQTAAEEPAEPADEEPWGYVYTFRSLRAYPLMADENRIGRLPENEIALTSSRVSRRHGLIRRTDDGVEFVDIGSSNGSRHNGVETRPRLPVALEPGDRVQVADEVLLYHDSLAGLWDAELRLRLLSSMVKMNADLPQDFTRKSLGREEVVAVSSEAVLSPDAETVELSHSLQSERDIGFPKGIAAFVGNVILEDGVLELSLWAIEGVGSMTSRRASISRLKHTTLRVSMTGAERAPSEPWFSQPYLNRLFDVYPEARDISLRFAASLAAQTRPVALRDAAQALAFRHTLSADKDWKLLALSAQSGGLWVDSAVRQRRLSLTQIERDMFARALEQSRQRLQSALALGAEGEPATEAASAIDRAEKRLAALEAR